MTISIIIPTYNRCDVLQRAIESVYNQTNDDWEMIIVDDGSDDATESVMREYDSNRITYIRFSENKGANAARNAGIDAARGRIISFLDSDDELQPTHLEHVRRTFSDAPATVGGVYTGFKVEEEGQIADVTRVNKQLSRPVDVLEDYPLGGFSTLSFRKSVFASVGRLDPEFRANQDREFLVRVLAEYNLLPVDELLVTYHKHGERLSDDATTRLDSIEQLVEKHEDKLTRRAHGNLSFARGLEYVKTQDMKKANRMFRRAIVAQPSRALYWLHYAASFDRRLYATIIGLKQRYRLFKQHANNTDT